MNLKRSIIASLSALALGATALSTAANAGGSVDQNGFHAGGGNIPYGKGDGFGGGGGGAPHGGGGGGGGGGVHNGGGGGGGGFHNGGGGGGFAHNNGGGQHNGGWQHGDGDGERHGGGYGAGAALGLGLLGAGVAAGALGGGYYNDDPGPADDCYRERPIYDSYGNYVGRRTVDICN